MSVAFKKIAAFFLLVLLLAPLSYMFIFQAKQLSIQHRMKKALEGSLLQTLIIPAGDLVWVKPGKEIMLDQKMFDIKTIECKADGNAHISGLFDHLETGLLAQMKKNWKQENTRGCKLIVQLFQLLQSFPDNSLAAVIAPGIITRQPLIADSELLPSPCKSIPTPPPQA